MESAYRECPLCHGEAGPEATFIGSYDHNVSHLTFTRQFYRCREPKCGAVFFFDELTHRDETTDWEAERALRAEEVESRRRELVDRDVYRAMKRAREEGDETVTKDRDLVRQVKEIEDAIAQDQVHLDDFLEQMRNFAWADPKAVTDWAARNWLPPSFAEKSLETNFAMCRPTIRKDLPDEERALLQRDDAPNFAAGDSVMHAVWGEGKVVQGNVEGGTIIVAEFPNRGAKKMDLRFAKLERVTTGSS